MKPLYKTWVPNIPNGTRMWALKLKSERRPLKCLHLREVKSAGGPMIIDFHCADCGEWLGDKDVS
jgi:hypothetical protein